MPRPCNIDARGKLLRLIYGVLMLLLSAALLALWAVPAGGWWRWAIAFAPALAGLLAIFEARTGWCIVRAMGFKTPM